MAGTTHALPAMPHILLGPTTLMTMVDVLAVPHNLGFDTLVLLQDVHGQNKPIFPVEITRYLPHRKAVPLAGAVGDSEVLRVLSIFLPVIVFLYTQWTHVDGSPIYLSFCYGKTLSTRCIIGTPVLMDMGPGIINLADGWLYCPNCNVGQIPIMLKEPTDVPLPLHVISSEFNIMFQACASSNVKGVHAPTNYIMIRHVQPVLDVRANSVTTTIHCGFNSITNPSLIL